MNESAPLLCVQNVGFTYQGFGFWNRFKYRALTDISFDVAPGETFGIVGANGCGKSTLLRVLCGLLKPTSGVVNVSNPYLTRSLLTLGLGFDPLLSGRNNALLSCMLQGASKSEANEMIDGIKEFSELGDFFERPVKTYSSGMRARLGFSTAITMKVDLLLIDETLGVGDKSFNQKAEAAMLTKLNNEQTVIFVSHKAAQVRRLCSRAIWLREGVIGASGDVDEVVFHYEEYTRTR